MAVSCEMGVLKGGLSDFTCVGFPLVVGKRGVLVLGIIKLVSRPPQGGMDIFFYYLFSFFMSQKGRSLANGISYRWDPWHGSIMAVDWSVGQ